ncbi:MAG: hypothetical protein N2234_00115 [Planctomycetota bacterium]|nr:hypothetical protein [Planctomycetota bacterium]
MREFSFKIFVGLWLLFAVMPLVGEEEVPFRVRALRKRIELKERRIILYGSVEVERAKLRFLCDSALISLDSSNDMMSIRAEGSVFLTDGTVTLEADSAFYDFSQQGGIFISARLRLRVKEMKEERRVLSRDLPERVEEIFLKAERIYAENNLKRFVAENCIISTCSFDEPHWGFRSARVELERDGTFKASGNHFFASFISFPLPSFYIEEEWWMPLRRLYFGSRSDFGSIFSTAIRIWQSRTITSDIRYEHYSLRGDGTGLEVRYREKNIPSVRLSGFYIHDEGERFAFEERSRWRTALDCDWASPQRSLLFCFRWRRASDSLVLRDYFERIYREDEPQESYGFLRYWWSGSIFSEALILARAEPFRTQTEYVPSFNTEVIGLSLFGNFLLDATARVEYIRRNYAETVGFADNECRRVFLSTKVSAPTDISFIRLNPYLASSFTSYSRAFYSDEEVSRAESSAGFIFSTLLWRCYNNRTLHSILPSLSYFHRFALTLEPDEVPYYDELEQVEKEQYVELAIVNLLQVESRRCLDFRSAYRIDARNGRDRLYLDVNALPFTFLALLASFNFSGDSLSLLTRRLRVAVNHKKWDFSVEDYYLRGMRHLLTFRLGASYEKRWAPSLLYQYDIIKKEYSKISFSLTHRLHCWIIEFGCEYDNVNDERRFTFYLSPFEFYGERRIEPLTMRSREE